MRKKLFFCCCYVNNTRVCRSLLYDESPKSIYPSRVHVNGCDYKQDRDGRRREPSEKCFSRLSRTIFKHFFRKEKNKNELSFLSRSKMFSFFVIYRTFPIIILNRLIVSHFVMNFIRFCGLRKQQICDCMRSQCDDLIARSMLDISSTSKNKTGSIFRHMTNYCDDNFPF